VLAYCLEMFARVLLLTLFVICASCFSLIPLPLHNQAASHNRRNVLATCPVYSCANTDQTCAYTTTNYITCLQSFCNFTTTTDTGISGICTSLIPNGDSCSSGDECVTNNCSNSICKPLAGQQALSACSANGNCYSGVCTSGVCEGVGIGKTCAASPDCTFSSYCVNATCVASPGLNQACTPPFCQLPYACTPTTSSGNYICSPSFSVAVGGYCSDSTNCQEGLACNDASSSVGTCVAVSNPSLKSCNISSSVSTCDTNEVCSCNGNNGQGICLLGLAATPVGVSSAYTAAVNCLNSKCSAGSLESCLVTTCSSLFCAYYNFIVNFKTLEISYPSCYLNALYQPTVFGTCLRAPPSTGSLLAIPVMSALLVPLLLSLAL